MCTFMLGWFLPTLSEVLIINHLIVAFYFFSCAGRLNKNTAIFLRRAVARTGTECSEFSVAAGIMLKHLKEAHYKIKYAINASRKEIKMLTVTKSLCFDGVNSGG